MKQPWIPGKGWITELVNKLPQDMRTKLRKLFLFRPDDVNDLYPFPRNRIKYPGVDRIQGFRYPAPGSREDVNVPQSESTDKLYDIKYYDRDTRRAPIPMYSWTPKSERVSLPPPPEPAKALGSPGNKNPAVLAYDPTGLRSAMSATNEALDKALQANMPNHLIRYEWQSREAEIIADAKAKGLPVPPGKPPRFKYPAMARQARW